MSVLDYIEKAKKKIKKTKEDAKKRGERERKTGSGLLAGTDPRRKTTLAKGMKNGDTVVVDGKRIPVIKPESEFIKRKPTKKEMQEDRAKNRPSRNITGDRAKQRKRKKLVKDMITTGMLGAGLGRKFGVKKPQKQKPLGEIGKKYI